MHFAGADSTASAKASLPRQEPGSTSSQQPRAQNGGCGISARAEGSLPRQEPGSTSSLPRQEMGSTTIA